MPKKTKLKKKRGGGGSHAGIPSSSALDFEAISHDLQVLGRNLEDVSFTDLMDPEEDVVEVVYVEPSLKRSQVVPFGASVSREWLHRCIQDSHSDWRDQLPSVEPAHLTGRVIPEAAQSFSDVASGKGLVVVELEEAHVNEGLVGQRATANATIETMVEANQALMQQLVDMEERISTSFATVREEVAATVREEVDFIREGLKCEIESCKYEIESLKGKNEELTNHIKELQAFMKKGFYLSNKVKKRVAHTLARTAVESAVGRVKPSSDTWSTFVWGLSIADWNTVGITKKLVKDLLADGAYEFNDSIHSIPAEEVVGSIVSLPHGSLRSAWEDIFFLAFKKHVSDEVFGEEIDYAMHKQHLLGES